MNCVFPTITNTAYYALRILVAITILDPDVATATVLAKDLNSFKVRVLLCPAFFCWKTFYILLNINI